ncbi:hypothetical protein [Polyangium aurulentum]|uniref:hypothetical protein n=1 Tax=Polyangium aurulentum TaxID=2567896 RepID=UPI00146C50EA|nr:hypothetical protein [Polyangium aurulentum]UQA63117.1 hypothetical protein E8A73_022705 [Polyangium aurulentum]
MKNHRIVAPIFAVLSAMALAACAKGSTGVPGGSGGAGGEGGSWTQASSSGNGGPGGAGGGGAGGGGGSGGAPQAFWVVRLGDGAAPLTGAAAPVFLDRRLTDGTEQAAPIALPAVAQGSNNPFTISGSATSEGNLALSANGKFVTLAGYAATVGFAAVSSSQALTVPRTVARVDAAGNADTTTRVDGAFNVSNVRGAVTSDGTAYWVSGNSISGSGGVHHVSHGATSGTQVLSVPINVRFVDIAGGQLYGSSGTGTFVNVFTVGSGLPTTPSQTATTLPGMPTADASPYAFALLDRSQAVAGVDTLYVADDRAPASGGGIQKWQFDGAQWSLAATWNGGLASGMRGLAAKVTGEVVVLVGTTAEASGNHVITAVDDGSSSPALKVVATAAPNTIYRGVAFAPQ